MKATINGIQVEGTPKEIYELFMLTRAQSSLNTDKVNTQAVAAILSELQKQHKIHKVIF